MYFHGNRYGYKRDGVGILIRRESDNAEVYLQGDDAVELEIQIDQLDEIAYPSGLFQTYEDHLDCLLDQYNTVMQPVVGG